MAKSLDANVITAIDAEQKAPRLLYELELPGLTLRFAASMSNIVFPHGGATTYTAKAIEFGGITQSIEGQIGRITVRFDNINGNDMGAYAHAYKFEGSTLTVKRIFLDANGNAPVAASEYIEVFKGRMETPKKMGYRWLEVDATLGDALKKRSLLENYDKPCRHVFGTTTTCSVDGYADLTTLTSSGFAASSSGTTTSLVSTGLLDAANYWKHGALIITKSSTSFKRVVTSSASSNGRLAWTIALPFSANTTDCSYKVWKGCDKTWETCGHNNVYGPSTDNTANFGGFIHIAQQREM